MPFETISFVVGGRALAHISATLNASAEEAVRTATFKVAHTGPGLPCRPDDAATISIGGALWGTGYVRDVNASHDENDRSYDVSFVSRTADATEASIDHPTGFKRDCTLPDIATEFDSYGVGLDGEAGTIRKRLHKVRPGETLFATLETDARAQGVMIQDTPEGKLRLADRPEGRHAGALTRGFNIKSATAQLSGQASYSKVRVRGQSSEGVTAAALRPEAEAEGTAQRKRVLILPHEGEATSDRLKKRADWEAKRAAGKKTTAAIVTPGWRDANGEIWTRNFLVEVRDDWLGIEQDMVIASVSLEQGSGGTEAKLNLKDPRALGGDNPRGASDAGWTPPGAAEPVYREG